MNLHKIGLIGVANAVIVSQILRWLMPFFSGLPTSLLYGGIMLAIVLAPLSWTFSPHNAERTVLWRRIAVAFALADTAVILVVILGGVLAATIDLHAIEYGGFFFEAAAAIAAWALSFAIFTHVLRDNSSEGNGLAANKGSTLDQTDT